jgi:hypothetical protein
VAAARPRLLREHDARANDARVPSRDLADAAAAFGGQSWCQTRQRRLARPRPYDSAEDFVAAVQGSRGVHLAGAVHEDDALRALQAAAEMQLALPELGIEGRNSVWSGEVVTGTEERLAMGDAVNVAARLQQAAVRSRSFEWACAAGAHAGGHVGGRVDKPLLFARHTPDGAAATTTTERSL